MDDTRDAARNLMLTRRGLLFLTPGKGGARAREIEAVLLELAALGYVASARLRVALEGQSTAQLAVLREQTVAALAEQLGARQTHTPLFRKFPRGIPRDTRALWFQRVLSHFIQLPDQPCVHCRREGTTHVLRPCEHVVCDRCYDGSNYSACPICNRKVDRSSPFFQPDELRDPPSERIRFKLVDLGDDLDATARSLFEDFCARTQALSPADKADFTGLIEACSDRLLEWLPESIPLKENLALILGRAFALRSTDEVLPVARARLRTATDVLRLIAVCSGADAALQGATVYDRKTLRYIDQPWWESWAASSTPELIRRWENHSYEALVPRQVRRFPMVRLPRPFRRALLEILDGLDRDSLIEDMLRHRSYWVWVGEFLHPGEYENRYPRVAEA
ncbi:MAG TPA: RING finger family 4 domain-containing protein, partial [Enhygromyxa sp.]|nr:RING finger family 4 domain-containing protein [Enhygromyxa sp.]